MSGTFYLGREITPKGRIERGMFFPDGEDNGYSFVGAERGDGGKDIYFVPEMVKTVGLNNPCNVILRSVKNKIDGIYPYFEER